MALDIVLYDTSPVVQKIFSHILYHYGPTIHRVDEPNSLLKKIEYSQPDIIFLDYSLSQNKKISEEILQKDIFQKVPVILIARTQLSSNELKPYSAKDFVQKPIESGQLRDIVNRLVPKTKSHVLTRHLQFPSTPAFDEEELQDEPPAKPPPPKSINLPGKKTGQPPSANQPPKTPVSHQKGGIDIAGEEELIEQPLSTKTSSAPPPSDEGIDPSTQTQTKWQANQSPDTEIQSPSDEKPDPPADSAVNVEVFNAREQKSSPLDPDSQDTSPTQLMSDNQPSAASLEPDSEESLQNTAASLEPDSEESLQNTAPTKLLSPKDSEASAQTSSPPPHEQEPSPKLSTKEPLSPKSGQDKWTEFFGTEGKELIQNIIEKAVWQVVPELSKQLVKKELDKSLPDEIEENTQEMIPNIAKDMIQKQLNQSLKEQTRQIIQDLFPKIARELIQKELDKLLAEEKNNTDPIDDKNHTPHD